MSYAAWDKRLAKCREMFLARQPIWWARPPFHEAKYKDQLPKWHLFKDRVEVDPRAKYRWVAKCGYSYEFYEILLTLPRLKLGKQAPKKAERCAKCVER